MIQARKYEVDFGNNSIRNELAAFGSRRTTAEYNTEALAMPA